MAQLEESISAMKTSALCSRTMKLLQGLADLNLARLVGSCESRKRGLDCSHGGVVCPESGRIKTAEMEI